MLNIIVAPKEQNSRAEKKAKQIVKYLKQEQVEYSVYFSQSNEMIKENMKQLLSFGESEFVIVGDDAIINTVLSCVKDIHKIKIGIVPSGKNDDFAKYLGISHKTNQAIKDILLKNIENVDVMIVNDMMVLNNIIIGAGVEVFHQYNQYKIKNFISEKIAIAKYGNKYPGIELSLDNKKKVKKETFFEIVIANGGFSKGRLVSPLSNLQDGLFNVTYSPMNAKSNNKSHIKLQNKGEHIYKEEVKQFWLNSLKITSPDKKIKALVDGKIQNFEEINCSIIEQGLKIYKKP